MFGIILALSASVFREIATSIGKKSVLAGKESKYTMGFLNMFWVVVFMFTYTIVFKGDLYLSPESLPTFLLRAILEIAQAHVTVYAIVHADRSTFGFLRVWTIPLLLLVDILLGYSITTFQILGIGLITLSFFVIFLKKGLKYKASGWVLFTAVNAVATISLYKYNITYFNSVEAEQGIMSLIVMLYLFGMAVFVAKENPLVFLRKRIFFIQSFSQGIAGACMSFAYIFAPASVIVTIKRSSTILTSIISGNLVFKEKKFYLKILTFIMILVGIILLTI